MQKYVLGFAFEGRHVALIKKTKPEWQAGKLNGIGGKVEPGEFSDNAMVREFFEETGRKTVKEDWAYFGRLTDGESFVVNLYKAFLPRLHDLESPTEEMVTVLPISEVNPVRCIPNLTWIIPMALSMPFDRAAAFGIKEWYGEREEP